MAPPGGRARDCTSSISSTSRELGVDDASSTYTSVTSTTPSDGSAGSDSSAGTVTHGGTVLLAPSRNGCASASTRVIRLDTSRMSRRCVRSLAASLTPFQIYRGERGEGGRRRAVKRDVATNSNTP